MLKLLMKIWRDFENRFNIVNSTLPNYWWRSSLQNMHALLEQYSTTSINIEKGHSHKGIKVSDLCKNKNLEIGPGTRHQEPLPTSIPRTACINPWTSKAPLLLAAHGPQQDRSIISLTYKAGIFDTTNTAITIHFVINPEYLLTLKIPSNSKIP